jgi:hypothetical protein
MSPSDEPLHDLPHDPDAVAFLAFLQAAACEVLREYGVDVGALSPEDEAPALQAEDLVAVLTFSGPDVRGSLALGASPGVLARSLPQPDLAATEAVLMDWAGELANQMLGRVKDRLAHHGGTLLVDTPWTGTAIDLGAGLLDPSRTVGAPLVGKDGHAFAWFEVHASPGFRLSGEPSPVPPSASLRQLF